MGRFAKVSRRKRLSNNIFQATGNFEKSRPPLRVLRRIIQQIQWLPAKFPMQVNREFLAPYQGKILATRIRNRELFEDIIER
jgi:hypothetical protein